MHKIAFKKISRLILLTSLLSIGIFSQAYQCPECQQPMEAQEGEIFVCKNSSCNAQNIPLPVALCIDDNIEGAALGSSSDNICAHRTHYQIMCDDFMSDLSEEQQLKLYSILSSDNALMDERRGHVVNLLAEEKGVTVNELKSCLRSMSTFYEFTEKAVVSVGGSKMEENLRPSTDDKIYVIRLIKHYIGMFESSEDSSNDWVNFLSGNFTKMNITTTITIVDGYFDNIIGFLKRDKRILFFVYASDGVVHAYHFIFNEDNNDEKEHKKNETITIHSDIGASFTIPLDKLEQLLGVLWHQKKPDDQWVTFLIGDEKNDPKVPSEEY